MPTVTNNINVSAVGASILNTASPSAVSWIRVNADNTITYRTAAQTVSDLAITTTNVSEGTNLYYTDARVRATTLTGLSITGSSIVSTDTVLQAFGKVQNQINAVVGGVNYQGTWNATTNTPALVSSVGTKGYYYVVSVAGSTNLDGITDWKLGDWVIFNGATWEKVDNTDAVISVNGYTGAVTLVKADVGLGNVENTALSTWTGSANLVTLGSAITGTGSITLGTSSSVAGSVVLKNATNAFTQTIRGTNPAASITYDLPTTAPTAGQVLTATAPSGAVSTLSWSTAASGITVGTTTITSGTTGRLAYNLAGVYQETISASFTPTDVSPYNVHLGFGAAISGSYSGTQNVFIGHQAGTTNTTASQNTLIGYRAGYALNTGGTNTALGYNALGFSNTPTGMVCLGYDAYGTATAAGANYSVAIGFQVNRTGTASKECVAIGGAAGQNNNIGDYNISIGMYANQSANFASSIAIGHTATNTATHQGVLGSNSANGYISDWYFNGVTHTAAYGVTLNGCGGSGSNNAGASMTFATRSTGNATPPNINFQTGTTLGSGSTLQTATTRFTIGELRLTATVPIKLKGYTVATLPTGLVGDVAYATDLLAPTFLTVATGGGAVVGMVFFDGTNWVTG